MQKTLSQETVHATSQGDKIQIVMDGNQKILSVDIDPTLLATDKKKNLEEGIKDAVNSGMKKIQTVMARKIQKGEIDMPDLGSLKK